MTSSGDVENVPISGLSSHPHLATKTKFPSNYESKFYILNSSNEFLYLWDRECPLGSVKYCFLEIFVHVHLIWIYMMLLMTFRPTVISLCFKKIIFRERTTLSECLTFCQNKHCCHNERFATHLNKIVLVNRIFPSPHCFCEIKLRIRSNDWSKGAPWSSVWLKLQKSHYSSSVDRSILL